MQSQLTRPSGHDHQEPGAPVKVHHPDEEHHEKKPTKVLKKVKEKAKKIKDTLTKLGHDDDHEHDHDHVAHIPDDHDLDEEDEEDEDEEKIDDPDVHGAPMYESTAVRGVVTGQPESLSHPGKAYMPTPEKMVPPGTKVFPVVPSGSARNAVGRDIVAYPMRVSEQEENREALKSPENMPDIPTGLEEDPTAPTEGSGVSRYFSNYQTKVADSTGEGGEIPSSDQMIQSFLKMKVIGEDDESGSNTGPGLEKELPRRVGDDELSFSHASIGSHDQFSLEQSPPKLLEKPSSEPEAFNTKDQPKQSSSYAEKFISSPASVVAGKAAEVKNFVVSKLQFSGGGENRGEEETAKSTVEYGKKVASTVAEKLTPVYEKVKKTGTSVMSQMPFYETHRQGAADKGVSVRDYLTEKLKPGEEDRALSEVIAEKLHLEKKRGKGRVTESKEVAERLGGFDDRRAEEEEKYGESVVDADDDDGNKGSVVEKLKGAFTSWLGGTTEEVKQESLQSLQDSSQTLSSTIGTVGSAEGDVAENGGGFGQRRLQESEN